MSGQNLSFIEAGKGLPVVFLHGFCETREIWENFLEPLSSVCRVILIDLPGFGGNPPLESPLTIADMAEQVYNTILAIGVDQCIMIGHSMGGYVALAFCEKFPSRLKGLGLFHSTAYADSSEKKQARDKTIDFIERYGTEEFVEEFVPPLFLKVVEKIFSMISEKWLKWVKKRLKPV